MNLAKSASHQKSMKACTSASAKAPGADVK
jgi:hypothetical protein